MIQFRDPFARSWRQNRWRRVCWAAAGVLVCAAGSAHADLSVNAYQGYNPDQPLDPPSILSILDENIDFPFQTTLKQVHPTPEHEPEESEISLAQSDFSFGQDNSFVFETVFSLEVAKFAGAYSRNYGSFRFSPDGDTDYSYNGGAVFGDVDDPYTAEYSFVLRDVTEDEILFSITGDPKVGIEPAEPPVPGNTQLLASSVYELSYFYNAFLSEDTEFSATGEGMFLLVLHDTNGIRIESIPAPGAVMLAVAGLGLAGARRRRLA